MLSSPQSLFQRIKPYVVQLIHEYVRGIESATVSGTGSGVAGMLAEWVSATTLTSATNSDMQVAAAVAASHTRSHALDDTSDHSIGALTTGALVKSDGTKLVSATQADVPPPPEDLLWRYWYLR